MTISPPVLIHLTRPVDLQGHIAFPYPPADIVRCIDRVHAATIRILGERILDACVDGASQTRYDTHRLELLRAAGQHLVEQVPTDVDIIDTLMRRNPQVSEIPLRSYTSALNTAASHITVTVDVFRPAPAARDGPPHSSEYPRGGNPTHNRHLPAEWIVQTIAYRHALGCGPFASVGTAQLTIPLNNVYCIVRHDTHHDIPQTTPTESIGEQ